MTACTNNGGNRARRAVTAALVGVLSVGAAPMVALATNAAPVSGEVQLQATGNPAFQTISIQYSNGESDESFVYNKGFQGLKPQTFSYQGSTEKINGNFTYSNGFGSASEGNHYAYVLVDQTKAEVSDGVGGKVEYVNEKGVQVTLRGATIIPNDASTTEVAPGTYAVVVYYANGTGNYVCRSVADTFTVVNGGFENASLYEYTAGDWKNTSDTTFGYNGKLNCGDAVALKSNILVMVDGVAIDPAYYTVGNIVEEGQNVPVTGSLAANKTYQVTVKGNPNTPYAGQEKTFTFTYGQLNLSNSVIVAQDATSSVPLTNALWDIVKTIDGVTPDSTNTFGGSNNQRLKVSVSGPEDGVYTYTITSSDFDDKNGDYITGTATVKVVVAQVIADVKWGNAGANWNGAGDVYTVDASVDEPAYFDASEISVETPAGAKVKDFTVTVKNAKTGADATVDNLDDRGEWLVTVTANTTIDGQTVAASETIKVVNELKLTDDANVFVSYDGKFIQSSETAPGTISGTYDGTDLTDKVSVAVKSGDKTLVEGTDYTVEYTTKDTTGKTVKVDSVTDAGSYTMTVKGVTYDGTATYAFNVAKRTLKSAAPSDAFAVENGTYYYSFTDGVIAPEYEFVGDDGKTYTVPADEFVVTYDKQVDGLAAGVELKAKGKYNVTAISLDAKNFTGAPTFSGVIEVTETGSFVDVPNDAWYAEEVAIAKQQGYIGGVGGTNFFAPMNDITRADFVCVLYRMAGGSIGSVEEGMTDEEITYISSFEDVDPNAYYAKAVAWATKMGIVNGYGTTFGTERSISTEEFAAMLARYAAKMGTDTTVDADAVLADVADGDEVSSYARDAVAWAVESGYLAKGGNLIDPQGSIYRARAIKIAVDYQPEQLDTILDQGGNAQGRN